MKPKTKRMSIVVTWFIAQGTLYLFGGWNVLFGVVCYLGGPDPRPGDLHLHIIWGTLWLAVGLAVLLGGRKAGRLARSHLRQAQQMPNQSSEATR